MTFKSLIATLTGQRLPHDLDALVAAYANLGRFSGSVLVAQDGHILLNKGYGLANREHDAPNTPQTVFRIGSMTKPFTAISVMQLAAEGKLSVSDRLSQFIPDFPHADRITLHHLLSNTSGIPDYIAMPAYSQRVKHRLPLAEVMAMFRDEPLRFEPGTDYGYSNSNWVLLGYILEQVTGRPYATIIRERIFAPAGMAHSGYEWEQPVIKGRATGYIDTGASVINAELHDESGMHAAGALYSTVEDVYKWDRALRDETLLPTATLSLMRQPFTQIEAGGYGYGWELHTLHGKHSTGHSGGLPGYVANYAHFDDGDLTIILLSNLGSAAWPDLTRDLAAIVFGVPYELPGKHTFIQLDPAILAAYAGDYSLTYFGRTTTLHFTVEDGALIMGTPGLPTARTSAISEDTFFARSKGEVILRFVRGADGAVTSIKLEWGGYDLTAERMAAATPKESEV